MFVDSQRIGRLGSLLLLGLAAACGDEEGSAKGMGDDTNDAGAGGEAKGGTPGSGGTGATSGTAGSGRGGSSGSAGTGGAGNSSGSSGSGEGGSLGGKGGAAGVGGAGISGGGAGGGTGGVGDCVEACAMFMTTDCTTAAANFCEGAEQSCQARYDDNPDCVDELASMDACAAAQPAANFTCPLGTIPDEVRPYRLSEDACVNDASVLDGCLN